MFFLMVSLLRPSINNFVAPLALCIFLATFASGVATSAMADERKLRHSLFASLRFALVIGVGIGLAMVVFS